MTNIRTGPADGAAFTVDPSTAALEAARVFALDVIGQLWGTACAGDPLRLDQRAQLSLATQHTFLSAEARTRYSKHLLGVPQPPQLL